MAKQPKGELVVVASGFDYAPLEADVAERARSAAARIREKVKRSIENIIEVGQDLLEVKQALPHGQFGLWLEAEFGWAERTARNFMVVAERFGAKSARIADLQIDATAAYLLAAPSVPEQAVEAAIERAEAGEQVTTAVAKEILAKMQKKAARKGKTTPTDKLRGRLLRVLERFRERWNQKELDELASVLRGFADGLGEVGGRDQKKGKH